MTAAESEQAMRTLVALVARALATAIGVDASIPGLSSLLRDVVFAAYALGMRRAASIVRSDNPNSRAEAAFAQLSERASELPPHLCGLFATLGETWADDAAETAMQIEVGRRSAYRAW